MPDSGGRWALGERSTLSVYMSDPDDLSLLIECKGTEVQTLSVLVNGAQVGRIQSTSEWKVHIFELDVNILKPGINLIEFTFERPPTRTAAQLRLGDPVTIIREMIGDLTPTAAHLEGILPAIQEIFPEASIYQDDVLNLPGVDVADVIRDPDAEDVGGGWQWESSASGSLSSKFRTISLIARSKRFADDPAPVWPGRDHGTLRVDRSGKLFIPLDSDSPARSITFTASTRVGFGGAADLQLSLISDDAPRELADESFEEFWGKTTFVDRIPLGTFSGPACLIVDADLNIPLVIL